MAWNLAENLIHHVADFELNSRRTYEGEFPDRHVDTAIASAFDLLKEHEEALRDAYSDVIAVEYTDENGVRSTIDTWHTPAISWDFTDSGLRRTSKGTWNFVTVCSVHQWWKKPGDTPIILPL